MRGERLGGLLQPVQRPFPHAERRQKSVIRDAVLLVHALLGEVDEPGQESVGVAVDGTVRIVTDPARCDIADAEGGQLAEEFAELSPVLR